MMAKTIDKIYYPYFCLRTDKAEKPGERASGEAPPSPAATHAAGAAWACVRVVGCVCPVRGGGGRELNQHD
jgi:hypothetical protein